MFRRITRKGFQKQMRKPQNSNPYRGSAANLTEVLVATVTVTLTFDQPVSLNGIPQLTSDVAGVCTAAVIGAARNIVVCTMSLTQAMATYFALPANDPAIRTASGGYAYFGQFLVS